MNTETINTQLYEKMFAEQERYRDWLLHQPPEEILNHTYEYTTREDILMTLEDNDLSFEQAWALLSSPTPLADVFKEFENRETDYMDVVRESMASRANTVIDRHQAPLYLHDAAYLRKIAIDGYVVQLDLPELREMVSLLRRSSNNLNQLARRANETGRIYPEDLADIRQNQAQLWESAKEILRVLSTLD